MRSRIIIAVILAVSSISFGVSYASCGSGTTSTTDPFCPPYYLEDSSNGNVARITVTSSGNVGITTTTPSQTFEVAGGNALFDQQAMLGRQNFASLQTYPAGADNAILNFYQAQNFPSTNAYDRSLDIVSGSANTASIMRFFTEPSGSSATPTEIMRIDYTGNVGIGSTSPSARLDVNGSKRDILIGDAGCGAGTGGIAFLGYGQPAFSCTNYAMLGDGANTYLNRPSGGFIAFREANSDELRIASGGNVGIGTTSPAQKLEVNGNMQVDGNYTTSSTNKELKISAPSGIPICIGTGC